MKISAINILGIIVAVGVVATVGCKQKSSSETTPMAGVGEKAGAALDRAAEKTVEMATNVAEKTGEAAKTTAEAAKNVAGQAVEKTGAALEKAGAATEKTGAGMQQ